MLPVPPATSSGSRPFVEWACGSGVVSLPTTGGGDGRGDELAAAATTTPSDAITTFIHHASTIPSAPFPFPDDARDAWLLATIALIVAPTLLPLMVMISANCSRSDRGRTSGGPLRDRRTSVRSSPMPTVALVEVARRGIDRPTVSFDCSANATPPRPGPASLLSPSLQPQPGCSAQRGGRVGIRHRAARKTAVGDRNASAWAIGRNTGVHDSATPAPQGQAVANSGRVARLDASLVGAFTLRCTHTAAVVEEAAHDREEVEQGTQAGECRHDIRVRPPPGRGRRSASGPTLGQASVTVRPPCPTPPRPQGRTLPDMLSRIP